MDRNTEIRERRLISLRLSFHDFWRSAKHYCTSSFPLFGEPILARARLACWIDYGDTHVCMAKSIRLIQTIHTPKKERCLAMSESGVRKCPKCCKEMEIGYLPGAFSWSAGRSLWSIKNPLKIFACRCIDRIEGFCRRCGYLRRRLCRCCG